jgi:hypothetical protein
MDKNKNHCHYIQFYFLPKFSDVLLNCDKKLSGKVTMIDIIILCLAAIFGSSLVFYLIYGKFTERKFDLIADKFKKQFGYTPFSITVGKGGGFFFWGYKESFLMSALIFPKFPATKRTLKEEEIMFFKNLKTNDISWFYIKYTALIIGLISFICLLAALKIKPV